VLLVSDRKSQKKIFFFRKSDEKEAMHFSKKLFYLFECRENEKSYFLFSVEKKMEQAIVKLTQLKAIS
jgi:hypothetical protein